jgi:hypothetical protein
MSRFPWMSAREHSEQHTGFAALRRERIDRNLVGHRGKVRLQMTPILVALVGVLPLAVAGLALLFVSRDSVPQNPHHRAVHLRQPK